VSENYQHHHESTMPSKHQELDGDETSDLFLYSHLDHHHVHRCSMKNQA
jgi:hypothetical protein